MRWIRAHKWTLFAAACLVAGIVLIAFYGYPVHTTPFWAHPWWWYFIWAGGIIFGVVMRTWKPRRQRSELFPGGKPCPPECRIRVSHRHDQE